MQRAKKKQRTQRMRTGVVAKVVENATMEIPEPMIESQVQNMINDYARRMQSQGLSLDQYMKFTGMTLKDLQDQTKPQAETRIRTRLTLEAVVKAENIQVTDEEVEKELQEMADAYKMELEKVKSFMGENELAQIKEDLAVQKAVDLLVKEAKLA